MEVENLTDQEKIYLLATKVMEWVHDGVGNWVDDESGLILCRLENWNPLRNIADAWMIVDKLRAVGFGVNVFGSGTGFNCEIYEFTGTSLADVDGKTAQEAICNAAINLLEAKAHETTEASN